MFLSLSRNVLATCAKQVSSLARSSVSKSIATRTMASAARVAIDGNEAAAHAIYQVSEAAMLFPITPSSGMGEHCDAWANKGKKNVYGLPVAVSQLQSEAGAAGALHGTLIGGLLGTTFSSSQGLMLMVPNMHKIAGELLPGVIHVSSRSVSKMSSCLYCDYSDVFQTRAAGFAFLSSHNQQEAHDLALVSHLASIESSVPFLHFFDGFRTSHEVASIELIDPEKIKSIFPFAKALEHKNRGMNPTHPYAVGVAQGDDTWMQNNQRAQPYYDAVPSHVQNAMDKVYSLTGRRYNLFDYVGAKDADRVIVVMGASASTAEETVKYLNSKGEKVGVVKVHLWRPFSLKHFSDVLPASVKQVCVLDKVREDNAYGDPLYLDVNCALRDSGRPIDVIGGEFGIGGKDFTPNLVKSVFDNMLLPTPKNHFTVGVVDDVGHTSLPIPPPINTLPDSVKQCILYGLGSDGTVGATQEAVKLIVENTSLFAQANFGFDAHKSGGLTVTHLRFGPDPIKAEYNVQSADYIGCHLASYVHKYNMLKNIKEGGTFVLNCPWKTVDELNHHLPEAVKRQIAEKKVKLYVIDATTVAQQVGLRQRVNMVMQSVFFKLSNVLPPENASELLANNIRERYGKKGDDIVQMNISAMETAAKELIQIQVPSSWNACENKPLRVFDSSVPEVFKNIYYPTTLLEGDDIPVSAFVPGGHQPSNMSKYEKRGFASAVPVWDKNTCTQCNQCSLQCPHAVIRPFLMNEAESKTAPASFDMLPAVGDEFNGLNFRIQISPLDCTGCEVCTNVCPTQSLSMKPLDEVQKNEVSNWDYAINQVTNKGELTSKDTVKGSQFQQPLIEFNGACGGCGETQYVKILTQMFGKRLILADAMGCSMVWGGTSGVSPFTKDSKGHGPVFACSLFEDHAEYGYGIMKSNEIKREKLGYYMNQAVTTSSVSSELNGMMKKWLDNRNDEVVCESLYESMVPLLQKEKSKNAMVNLVYEYRDMLPKVNTWLYGGDGWAYDIGFGGLDHVLASGDNIKIMILDTEMYANTGGQQSKATQLSTVAKFASGGKRQMKKDIGKVAMNYKNIYVASVAIGYDPKQTIRAISEANSYNGPALIVAYSPCQQHGMPSHLGMSQQTDEQRKAVESGYWPLYRYDPRKTDQGENPFQLDFKKLKMKVKDFIEGENRFQILTRESPEVASKLHETLQGEIDRRHAERVRMSLSDKQLFKELKKTMEK